MSKTNRTNEQVYENEESISITETDIIEVAKQINAIIANNNSKMGISDAIGDNPLKKLISLLNIGQCTTSSDTAGNLLNKTEHKCLLLEDIYTQVWYLKSPRKYGFANIAHANFLGKRLLDVFNCDIYDLMEKEEADQYFNNNLNVFETGKPTETNQWLIDSKGRKGFFAIRKNPKFDNDGNIKYVICTAHDITDQKIVETNLLHSKQTYFDIFNSVSEAIYILDETFHIIDVNEGALKMHGLPKGKLIGLNAADCSAPGKNNIDQVNATFKKVFQHGHSESLEFWSLKCDGETILKSVNVNKGKYFGKSALILTARNITKKRIEQEKLKKSNEKYMIIVENTTDIIIVLDRIGNILFVNDSKLERLGYKTGEILGASFLDFTPSKELPALLDKLINIEPNQKIKKFESKLVHKKGHLVDVEIVGKSIYYEEKPCVQFTVHNISDKKQAEKETKYQIDLRQTITELSSTFINIPLDQTQLAIKNALKRLTHFIDADRAYLFEYNYETQSTSNTLEYSKKKHPLKNWGTSRSTFFIG